MITGFMLGAKLCLIATSKQVCQIFVVELIVLFETVYDSRELL